MPYGIKLLVDLLLFRFRLLQLQLLWLSRRRAAKPLVKEVFNVSGSFAVAVT